jgi:hypothetical protein
LETEHAWQFDVIELERVTDHHPLAQLGVKVSASFRLIPKSPSDI